MALAPGGAPRQGIITPPHPSSIEKLLSSNGNEDAEVFTLATHPFNIVHVNPAWTKLCGWRSAEVLGLTCKIMQGPETSSDALRVLHSAIEAHRTITVRLVNYTKSGEKFLNELTFAPLLDDTNRVKHFLGTVRRVDGLRRTGTSAADMAVAAAWNASGGAPQGPTAALGYGTAAAALNGRGRMRAEEVESGANQSASDERCSELLLSREAFPLDTLNHHPVAPVLLRMLQLNTTAGAHTFSDRT